MTAEKQPPPPRGDRRRDEKPVDNGPKKNWKEPPGFFRGARVRPR